MNKTVVKVDLPTVRHSLELCGTFVMELNGPATLALMSQLCRLGKPIANEDGAVTLARTMGRYHPRLFFVCGLFISEHVPLCQNPRLEQNSVRMNANS